MVGGICLKMTTNNTIEEMLETVSWGEFLVEDVFETVDSSTYSLDYSNIEAKYKNKKEVAYITRSNINNGVGNFIGDMSTIGKKPIPPNCITIGLDTATVKYQPMPFYTGQNVHIIRGADLTKYNALFLIPLIEQSLERFGWGGFSATLSRFRNSRLLLPTKGGLVDWEFMDSFMYELETVVKPVQTFTKHHISDFRNLDQVEWNEFKIGDVFNDIQSGKGKGLVHLKKGGDIPYVGATNRNNGVLTFVNEVPELITKGNSIVFIRNGEGSMGYSVYKSEDFIATSDVSVGYNYNINKYTGVFITTLADQVRGKYNFGYKRSETRLKNERLLLPVMNDGSIDWEFMEQYMKRIENELIEIAYT